MKFFSGILEKGFLISVSVLITLIFLRYFPSLQGYPRLTSIKWAPTESVQVDVVKIIQRQASQLGKQKLSPKEIQEKVATFLPRLTESAHQLSKRHQVMIFMKGATLSPLPDWTEKIEADLNLKDLKEETR